MIKVTPFIKTLGTERYKELLSSPFEFSMLETHFTGWNEIVEDYYKKYGQGNTVISVLPTPQYEIEILGEKYIFPHPKTLNDFINDMDRILIDLFWGSWIEENYEPKDFLPQNEIENYYTELLNSLDKGHELLTEKRGDENGATT